MRTSLFGLAVLFALCGRAFGNTGVFAGSGHSLQLVKSADVQMVSEDVTITPICGVSSTTDSVDFRCTFVLRNRSAKPLTIQAGFPLDRGTSGPPPAPSDDTDKVLSYHFIARDSNDTYHVRYAAGDPQGKYAHIFLWDMTFAAGETKTLHVGYILPMSFAASTTRKVNDPAEAIYPPEYEKPWHARIEACMVVYFSYITETGQSWTGPIERATFRVNSSVFGGDLRRLPEYVGGNPANAPAEMATSAEESAAEDVPGMSDLGFVLGMKLGTVYPHISPKGWKPAYIPEIHSGEPKPNYKPDGIAWTFENYKPGRPLEFNYYLAGFPQAAADCDSWVKCVLGKTPTKADVLELREIVAAFFGVAPQTASVKRLVEQQVWYNPQSKATESDLSKSRQVVLARIKTIADNQKTLPRDSKPRVSPLIAQEPGLRELLKGHVYQVTAVAFSPDGKTLASASCDRRIKLWDAAAGKNTATLKGHGNAALCVAFSRDSKTLASADWDGVIKLWNVANGKDIATIKGHTDRVESLAFSPDGKALASASDGETTVKVWDVATGRSTATFSHSTNIRCVAYSPDGKTIASGGNDNVVYLWDVSTGKNTLLKGHTDCIFSLAFSPDGKTVASASGDMTIKLWDTAATRNIATLKDTHCVLSVTFSPDGKTLATGSQGETIRLWDAVTGASIATLGKHISSVTSLSFSPDGKTLVSSGDLGRSGGNAIPLWDVKKFKTGSK